MNIREDGRAEWVCKHGVGHTISVPEKYQDESAWWSHGCDGCCDSIKPIIDEKDEEIKDLKTALVGYDKIIMDYPILEKKLKSIEKECGKITKEHAKLYLDNQHLNNVVKRRKKRVKFLTEQNEKLKEKAQRYDELLAFAESMRNKK